MKYKRFAGKFISTTVLCVVTVAIIANFSTIFPALNQNALALTDNKSDNPANIPSNLNFLNDDKKTFLDYCHNLYGEDLPLSIDNDLFAYYGNVDGYRLYRIQANGIPYEHAHQTAVYNGYTIESDYLFRPSRTGLYLICDGNIWTLEDACKYNAVNMADIFKLYSQKSVSGKSSSKSSSNSK